MPIIPELDRQRQEDCGFEATPGYMVRPYLKRSKKKNKVSIAFKKQKPQKVVNEMKLEINSRSNSEMSVEIK
jgi:hypothetical protein